MDYRTEFRKGITKGEFSKCKNDQFNPENPILFESAVLQGYDDAKRTFTNIGKFWQEHNEFRKNFFETIAKEIQKIFREFPAEGFDIWHEKMCDLFLQRLEAEGYKTATYGQAQKVINMAFKYLYCLDGAEASNKVFDLCHMPLDSFTLTWYKRYDLYQKEDGEQAKLNEQIKWSNMKKETYLAVTKVMKTRLEEGQCLYLKGKCYSLPKKPLYAEFVVWPEMQMHLATEAFLFSIDSTAKENKKKWEKEKDLQIKLETVRRSINNYI